MNAPRRLLDDPEADAALRDALTGVPKARSLDAVTRRRLSAKVARASALPAVAAGWLFVKSAAAALGVVLGTGAIAVSTGVVEWMPTHSAPDASPSSKSVKAPRAAAPEPAPLAQPVDAPPESEAVEQQKLNPAPSLPSAAGSAAGTLSAEAALLEQARRQMRTAPDVALAIAQEHATRFPRAQLGSERTLIQIEALHRLGRNAEARALASRLLDGSSAGLYAERVHQLLGAGTP